MPSRIVTFTTDFGLDDPYVAAMKGAAYRINPELTIVDIGHATRPHDVVDAGFVLAKAYPSFPVRSIHVAVVDPGVGGPRRPIIVSGDEQYFVGPDNGIFSFVYRQEEDFKVYVIEEEHYFHKPLSNTFHGRDIFAPVAAWMTRGIEVENFGPRVEDFVRVRLPEHERLDDRTVRGHVIHVDNFGNLVTNIPESLVAEIEEQHPGGAGRVVIANKAAQHWAKTYSDIPDKALGVLIGSLGAVEISANRLRADKALGVGRGTELRFEWVGGA